MSRLLVALVLAVALAGCMKTSTPATPTPTVGGVVVTGTGVFTNKNDTSQLTATATFSDGTTQNVSSTAFWSVSNPAVATVSKSGVVTAVSLGTATITASLQGEQGHFNVVVSLKAIAMMTPKFSRVCDPLRGRLELTIAETGNSIGFNMTDLSIIFYDRSGIWEYVVYVPESLTTKIGSNHFNAGQSRILVLEAVHNSRIPDTLDWIARISALVIDDAGATTLPRAEATVKADGC